MNESALSGSLNLGHYGVTQSNSFESVDVNGHGAQLVTPFAKLQLPYKVTVLMRPLEQGRQWLLRNQVCRQYPHHAPNTESSLVP